MNVLRGRNERRAFSAETDVVVVGSGAAGSIVAREVARAGYRVIVVEEGGYYAPDEYGALSPSHALRTLVREAGLSLAVPLGNTPAISVMAGRCIGGSSVLTGGVCFRIPDDVLYAWKTKLGLTDLGPESMAPFFEEIERDIAVETVPEAMRSKSTQLFVRGADALGIPMKSVRRNTRGCRGASRCNFGCPHGAKISVDVAVLPEACERGAQVISDALVERVECNYGVASGVQGHFLAPDEPASAIPFSIRARVVVIACGALHTPLLLKRSGLGSKHVGRHLTLHPAFRVGALFDERVDGWDGAMQSVYSDHFAREGLTLVSAYTAPNVLAAAFPGVGQEHRRAASSLANLAFFGAMVHDSGGGSIRRWVSREPLVTYRMAKRDVERMWLGIQVLGELALAGGARAVMLPIFGQEPVSSRAQLETVTKASRPTKKVECMSFHPLGSAKMGATHSDSVVDSSGQLWNARNVVVADASVIPTSIGVNSQVGVMAMAMRIARHLVERLGQRGRAAA